MSISRMLSRLVLASLVAALIAAPAASAMPSDPQGTAVAMQDARGEAAASGGGTGAFAMPAYPRANAVTMQDARGEAAASGGTAAPVAALPLPPRAVPVAGVSGDGGGVDLPIVLLIIAGTLAIGGGMAVAGNRVSVRTAH